MEWLRTIAYWLALLIVATFPPAIVYWLIIHPFASFWRRVGRVTAFVVVGTLCIALAVAIGLQHERILAVHWGYHWPMVLVGLAIYGFGIQYERQIRKQLKFSVLAGAPELNPDSPGELLREGVYARSRNPRYVNILLVMVGWSLMLNFPAVYIVTAISFPALYVVVLLEERELRARFGEAYEAYCREVPRFL